MSERGLRLELLGTPQITQDDNPVTGFVSRKAQALLCYLTVTGRTHTRDRLAGLFWPEMPETDAKTNLRKALSNLRSLLAPFLVITRYTVAFNRESNYWLDVEAFIGQTESVDRPDEQPVCAETAAQLAEAVRLYRGDFLEGFHVGEVLAFEEWVMGRREWLRERNRCTLQALADYYTNQRQYDCSIDYLTRLLALDPWREEAHRRLMLLLVRSGQRCAALAQYETCCRVLAEELGITPLAETTALYERIRALKGSPLNLPRQPAPFLGRDRELEEIAGLLASPDCRLLTLLGLGGVGKTRLAVQAVARLGDLFLDGIHFVPLASVRGTDSLLQAVAAAVGFAFGEQGHPREQLLTYLQARELLLLLDNFEHLLVDTPLLETILARAADVKILVTSRERLNSGWEWLFEVAGLDFPAETAAWADVEQYSAGQLFIQSARRIQPGFRPVEADNLAIGRICRLLGGLPLGLELAAQWVRSLSCLEIAREIETNFDFLGGSAPHLDRRHRSMRAVLARSWQMLSPAEQRVFRQLSVFRGGFARPAAEYVSQATPPILAALVDKALLQHTATNRYEMHQLWLQYGAEQLAARAGERKEVEARHSRYYLNFLRPRQRLLAHRDVETGSEISLEFENLWLGWQWAIEQGSFKMIDGYVTGLYLFLESQNRFQEIVTLLAETLSWTRRSTGLQIELQPDKAVQMKPVQQPPAHDALQFQAAVWQRQLGEAYFRLGRLAESEAHHLQALVPLGKVMPASPARVGLSLAGQLVLQGWRRLGLVNHSAGSPVEEAQLLEATQAYERLGQIYFFTNQALSGFYTALRGLNLAETASPSPALARLYANMCLGMALIPLHPLARMYIRLALNTARQIDHEPSLAWVLELSGIYHSGVAAWPVVDRSAGQSAEISRRLGDRRRWEESLVLLASLAYYRGQFEGSVDLWQQIYRSALQRGDAQVQQWSLCGQAESSLPLGRTEHASDLLKRALHLPVEIADHSTDISCYGLLAVAEWRLGRPEAARTSAEKGLQLIEAVSPTAFSSLEGYTGVAETYGHLWTEDLAGKGCDSGLEAKAAKACKALAGFARIFPLARPRAWLCRGHLAWISGRPRQAQKLWEKSLAAANNLAMPYEAGLAHARMGRNGVDDASLRQENLSRAREIFTELGAAYELGRM